MRLTELLRPQNIKLQVVARGKTDAITELVGLLSENKDIPDAKLVLDAVLEREATRTTGIGNGVAIPHSRCPGVEKAAIALGKCPTPIEFGSIDGRPVTWIWLLASPPEQANVHLQVLARISRLMTIDKFRRELAAAPSSQDVLQIIAAQEATL